MENKTIITAYINMFGQDNYTKYNLNNYIFNKETGIYSLYTTDGFIFEADKSNVVIRRWTQRISRGEE